MEGVLPKGKPISRLGEDFSVKLVVTHTATTNLYPCSVSKPSTPIDRLKELLVCYWDLKSRGLSLFTLAQRRTTFWCIFSFVSPILLYRDSAEEGRQSLLREEDTYFLQLVVKQAGAYTN